MIVTELQFINAFFGFCTSTGGLWPNPLQTLGYEVIGIEREVTVSGPARDRTVVPDIICGASALSHVLCVDAKSQTIDGEQELAYMQMESDSLFIQGVVPSAVDRTALSHDNALATSRSHGNTLVRNMARESVSLPVLLADEKEFAIGDGEFREKALNDLFTAGVEVAAYEWPTKFVKFTSRSSESEMVPVIGRVLIERLRDGGDFTSDDVIMSSIDHFHLVGRLERRDLRKKVTSILDQGCIEELSLYYRRVMPEQRWTVTTQISNSPNSLEALHRRVQEFVHRHELDIPFRKDQPSLFGSEVLEPDEESDG